MASPRTPSPIALEQFQASIDLGANAANWDYYSADFEVDATRCRHVTGSHRWRCPFWVHGHYMTWDDDGNKGVKVRVNCHAKAFVTHNAYRFSRKLSGCPDSWLP